MFTRLWVAAGTLGLLGLTLYVFLRAGTTLDGLFYATLFLPLVVTAGYLNWSAWHDTHH